MPQTKAKRPAATKKEPAARKRRAVESKKPTSALDRGAELSEEVLRSGQRAAIEAVRKFVDTVDQALPAHDENPSKRQEVIDGAMEMADRLVHVQYDFLRKVVDNASQSLARSDDGK